MPQAARKKHHNLLHYFQKNVFHTKPHSYHGPALETRQEIPHPPERLDMAPPPMQAPNPMAMPVNQMAQNGYPVPGFPYRQGYNAMLPAPRPGRMNSYPGNLAGLRNEMVAKMPRVQGMDTEKGHTALGFRVDTARANIWNKIIRGDLFNHLNDDAVQYIMALHDNGANWTNVIRDKGGRVETPHGKVYNEDVTTMASDLLEMFRGYLTSPEGLKYVSSTTDTLADLPIYHGDRFTARKFRVLDILNRNGPGARIDTVHQNAVRQYTANAEPYRMQRPGYDYGEADMAPLDALKAASVAITEATRYYCAGAEEMGEEWNSLPNHTKMLVNQFRDLLNELEAYGV